jgi:hypothetical protein
MRTKHLPPYTLSYDQALLLWETRQLKSFGTGSSTNKNGRKSSQVLKCHRALGIARAKDWAAAVYGVSDNQQLHQEETESPLFDHTSLHPLATKEDIKAHLHKAVNSIGIGRDTTPITPSHPVVHREFILLLLRFNGKSVPSKSEFACLVQVYLTHLRQATLQIDDILDKLGIESLKRREDELGPKP